MILILVAILVMIGLLGLVNILLNSLINSIAPDEEITEEPEQSLTIEQ